MTTQNKQIGSLLIEAMIALVVLALGIVAIAKLQGSFMRSGADAQSRNVALQLAQQKIDDMRAYNLLYGTTIYPTTRPFQMIADNQGGSNLPMNPTVSNTRYSISWTVSNFDGTGAAAASIEDTSYKKVNMLVTWTDIGGTSQSQVRLNSYIGKINAYGSKALSDVGVGGVGPQVIYNPGAAPDVIAIDTDGETTETTLPEPAIKKIASTDYFYSQFETVTYTGGNVELRNEEFLNIRCECEYGNNHIGLGFPVARSIWHPSHENDVAEHTRFVTSFFHPAVNDHAFIAQTESGRADFLGEMITKVVGQSAAGASSQHPFCNTCCRDHHDVDNEHIKDDSDPPVSATDTALSGAYACNPNENAAAAGDMAGDRSKCADPWRPADDYDEDTGDHKHYTAAGLEVPPGTAPGPNGTYLEACRLKRINGKFNVFQDWHLHGSTYVAAAEDAFDPDATGNKFDEYRQYIKNYVEAVITNHDNLPVTTIINPATSFVWPPSGTTITSPISKQFIARGIYMDYLDSYTLDRLNEVVGTASFFENAPFNEINLTRLSNWQPECVNGSNPNQGAVASTDTGFRNVSGSPVAGSCVTNYGILAALVVEDINRGLVRITSASDAFTLSADILLSNNGLIGINQFLKESSTPQSYPTAGDRSYDIATVKSDIFTIGTTTPPSTSTYTITVSSNSTGWVINSSSCNGGACSNLAAGTYTVAVTLLRSSNNETHTCSKSYVLPGAGGDVNVTVTKGTSTNTCSMNP